MPTKHAMATRNFAKYWLAALAAVACTVQEPVETQAPKASEPEVSTAFVPGTAMVEFDDALTALIEEDLAGGVATKSASLDAMLFDLNIEKLERVFPYAGEFEERTRREGMHRFYKVSFREDVPVTKAVASIETVPGVVSVSPERKIKLRGFDDPKLSSQWHYINSKYSDADINVKEVWEKYTVGSNRVIVCVVDEPVDPTHPDLQWNLWTDAGGHTGYNFAKNSYDLSINTAKGYGDIGHGTHVAGTIAAVNNNGVGLCGVAGGDYAAGIPGVRIQSCAIFSGEDYANDSATANAIKWGADHGAVISQNSWGYVADTNGDGKVSASELSDYKSTTIYSALKKAIDYFITYAGCDNNGNQLVDSPMKGGLVMFAAGNENIDYDPICNYEPVIAVGAFRETGKKASYSNYGSWVDIAAPGGEGTSTSNSVWSTLPNKIADGYGHTETTGYYGGNGWAGTSMACPHASGVAALIVSYYGGEGFTNERAKEILFAGLGDTIGGSSPIGKKLDALKSFQYGGSISGDPLVLSATEVDVRAHEVKTVTLTVTASPDAVVNCTPGSTALEYDRPSSTITITGKNAEPGTYTAVFSLVQDSKEVASVELNYTLYPNHAPIVTLGSYKYENFTIGALNVTSVKAKPLGIASLFYDEDGESLSIHILNSNPEVVGVKDIGEQLHISSLAYGCSTITVQASDSFDKTAEFSFVVAVKDPDKASKPEVFPEAATDKISLWPVNTLAQTFEITIYSSTGAKVMSLEADGGLYQPIEVDITSLAPGVYTAVLKAGAYSEKVKFVKY